MKKINGFYWPDHDRDCHPVVPNQLSDLDYALNYTKQNKVCIQAGGNVGVWPKKLSTIFDVVYTFEPDPENFNCLAHIELRVSRIEKREQFSTQTRRFSQL